MREVYSSVDMKTILDMQISLVGGKKLKLPGRPDGKGSVSSENIPQPLKVEGTKSA